MSKINLLPWREAEQERKNREFRRIMTAVGVLSLLVVGVIWGYLTHRLADQQRANEIIKQEISGLDKTLVQINTLEKQQNDMLARIKVIQDLQGYRSIPVHVWADIATLVPNQLYLINMIRVGDMITFKGKAANPDIVATFIRNLDSAQWLENSAMKNIQQPQATAYQPVSPSSTTAAIPPPIRPAYPEDSYVSFEVTTHVINDIDNHQIASAPANTIINQAGMSTASSPVATTTNQVFLDPIDSVASSTTALKGQ